MTVSPTPTPTNTVTPTITDTPYPILDISANIDGACVNGDTTAYPDNYQQGTLGAGAPDVAYSFTLTSAKSLFISLCNSSFDTALYVRTHPADPSTTLAVDDDSPYCGAGSLQSSLVTGLLQPGTYYAIVDGNGPGDYGPFSLCLSTFIPACPLTPVSVPVTMAAPATVADLGALNPTADTVYDLAGAGHVDDYLTQTNSWTFTPAYAGAVSISLDCFDDGTQKAMLQYDLYDSAGNPVTTSNGYSPVDSLCVTLTPQQYTVVVYTKLPGQYTADYRLVVQSKEDFGYWGKFGQAGTDGINGDFEFPVNIAFSPDGNYIAVSDVQYGNVQVFDGSFNYLYSIAGYMPSGMAIDGSDRVYVADYGYGVVVVYDLTNAGNYLAYYSGGGSLVKPIDVKFDNSGNLVVSDYGAQHVFNINWSNDTLISSYGGTGFAPTGVAVDTSGNVYVAAQGPPEVIVCDSGLNYQYAFNGSTWPVPLGMPYGIAVDSQNNLIISDMSSQEVVKCDTSGNYIENIGAGDFANPDGVALDAAGDLFVVDGGLAEVLEFMPQ